MRQSGSLAPLVDVSNRTAITSCAKSAHADRADFAIRADQTVFASDGLTERLQGTPAPTIASVSNEELNSLTPELRFLYTALRQQKVDVHYRDHRLARWLSHDQAILRHVAYIKQSGQGIERYRWHTPAQLGLDLFYMPKS